MQIDDLGVFDTSRYRIERYLFVKHTEDIGFAANGSYKAKAKTNGDSECK